MPVWWNTCDVCGDSFASSSPNNTNCGNARKHARLNEPKKNDDKKDGKK